MSERERTFSWADPFGHLPEMGQLSGFERMTRLLNGQFPLPPIMKTMDYQLDEVEIGRAVVSSVVREMHLNPAGTAHGGLAATLLDSAMGFATHTLLEPGYAQGTTDLTVRYLRPLLVTTGRVFCEGVMVHRGRSMVTATGTIADAQGKLYATGTSSLRVFEWRARE